MQIAPSNASVHLSALSLPNCTHWKIKTQIYKALCRNLLLFVSVLFLFCVSYVFSFSGENCRFGIPKSPEQKKQNKKEKMIKNETNTKHSGAICFLCVLFLFFPLLNLFWFPVK